MRAAVLAVLSFAVPPSLLASPCTPTAPGNSVVTARALPGGGLALHVETTAGTMQLGPVWEVRIVSSAMVVMQELRSFTSPAPTCNAEDVLLDSLAPGTYNLFWGYATRTEALTVAGGGRGTFSWNEPASDICAAFRTFTVSPPVPAENTPVTLTATQMMIPYPVSQPVTVTIRGTSISIEENMHTEGPVISSAAAPTCIRTSVALGALPPGTYDVTWHPYDDMREFEDHFQFSIPGPVMRRHAAQR